jgi:hypothetical protein
MACLTNQDSDVGGHLAQLQDGSNRRLANREQQNPLTVTLTVSSITSRQRDSRCDTNAVLTDIGTSCGACQAGCPTRRFCVWALTPHRHGTLSTCHKAAQKIVIPNPLAPVTGKFVAIGVRTCFSPLRSGGLEPGERAAGERSSLCSLGGRTFRSDISTALLMGFSREERILL